MSPGDESMSTQSSIMVLIRISDQRPRSLIDWENNFSFSFVHKDEFCRLHSVGKETTQLVMVLISVHCFCVFEFL